MKIRLPKSKYIKSKLVTTTIGFAGGVIILFSVPVGIILFLIDLLADAKIMETIDTREDIKKTNEEIRKAKKELEELLKEIKDAKKKTFSFITDAATHRPLEDRIKKIENEIGLGSGHSYNSLSTKVKTLEGKLEGIKRKIGI